MKIKKDSILHRAIISTLSMPTWLIFVSQFVLIFLQPRAAVPMLSFANFIGSAIFASACSVVWVLYKWGFRYILKKNGLSENSED